MGQIVKMEEKIDMKIGFIGCGNMEKAMINGILSSGQAPKENIMASAKTEATRNKIREQLGIRAAESNREAVEYKRKQPKFPRMGTQT